MLFGLGRQLRRCGVDTIELPSRNVDGTTLFKRITTQITEERRMVLSQGNCVLRLCRNCDRWVAYSAGAMPCRYNVMARHRRSLGNTSCTAGDHRGCLLQLRNYLPQCILVYDVPRPDSIADQLKQVLKHFNIVVRKDDVFSRCKVSRETLACCLGACGSAAESSLVAQGGAPSRSWRLDIATSPSCFTTTGIRIQVEAVPRPILDKLALFFVCNGCGEVFRDGNHLERALSGKILRGTIAADEDEH